MNTTTNRTAEIIKAAAIQLVRTTREMNFSGKVAYTYNPLDYAWSPHAEYIQRFAQGPRKILFVGMNPGPWGMAQTGVPFGEITFVKEWMHINGHVEKPDAIHPKKPIEGFNCTRSEVSGRRLWSLMREHFGTAEEFFRHHYVANYCPLVFMETGGKNLTPDKLTKTERHTLFDACDTHLLQVIQALNPGFIIGIGKFSTERIRKACSNKNFDDAVIDSILHPSPASPQANRGWAEQAISKLELIGAWPIEK